MRLDAKELRPGDVLGRYQLLLPIARGGMGQVWAARPSGTRGTEKLVAIKTILPSREDSEQLESMLLAEASLASLIQHANVAETYEHGEQEGVLYLVMEWVDGEPLDQILRAARPSGGIPISVAVHLIVQALAGLQAAHEARNAKGELLGLVHRDISPQNLLVTYSGVVKLVDFGVAKATQQMSQPTESGEVKGKFAYMSPEQVQGDPVDARADVFAMGIVLYRITTGRHPFKGDNPAATLRNILMRGPALPSRLVPGYPKALEMVVMKALAREKNARFASAKEMMLALEHSLSPPLRPAGQRETEALMRRLFETRIDQRIKALRAAVHAADPDPAVAILQQYGKMFPRSQPSIRAVSIGGNESSSVLAVPRRKRTTSPAPRPKRRMWPALLALAVGLVLPLVFAAIHDQPSTARNAHRLDSPVIERAGALPAGSVISPAPVAGEKSQPASVPSGARDASADDGGRRSRLSAPGKSSEVPADR